MGIFRKIRGLRALMVVFTIICWGLFISALVGISTTIGTTAELRSIHILAETYIEAHLNRDLPQLARTFHPTDTDKYHNFIANNQDYFDAHPLALPEGAKIKNISHRYQKQHDGYLKLEIIIPDEYGNKANTYYFSFAPVQQQLKWQIPEATIDTIEFKKQLHTPTSHTHYKEAVIVKDKTITEVTLQNGDTVSHDTFRDCHSLTQITLPKSLDYINPEWFHSCNYLTRIIIDKDSPYFQTIDGVVYSKDGTSLICYPKGKIPNSNNLGLGVFHIPSTVTSIAPKAFSFSNGITQIIFPSSMKSVEDSTFFNCQNLKSVILNEGLLYLLKKSFYNCNKLETISIPNSVKHIGNECFYNNTALSNVTFSSNSQLAYVGLSSFENCTSLKSITLPKGIKKINNWSFQNCTSLKEAYFLSALTSIGLYSFRNCKNLEYLFIPKSVTFIDRGAFADCRNLTLHIEHPFAPSTWNSFWNLDYTNKYQWSASR